MRNRTVPRAFTLLEVAVATALTAVLMVMALQWVGQLARSGALGGIQRQAERDAQWVMTNLSRDAAAAGPCDANGLQPTLATLARTALAFYVDDDRDGMRDLVTWEVSGREVIRRVQVAEKPCEFSTTSTEVLLTNMVRPGTTEVFRVIAAGDVEALGAGVANCVADVTECMNDGEAWVGARVVLILSRDDGTPLAKLDDAITWSGR